jgi:hypothetical protein
MTNKKAAFGRVRCEECNKVLSWAKFYRGEVDAVQEDTIDGPLYHFYCKEHKN